MISVARRMFATPGGIGFATAVLLSLVIAFPAAFITLWPAVTLGGEVEAAAQEKLPVLIGFVQPPGPTEEALVRGLGGEIKYTYRLVPAIAASVPPGAVDALRRNPRVSTVDPDMTVRAIDAELDSTWGVKRIGAGTVHDRGNTGANIKVAIIDTGIDYTHPDLAANYDGGYDFVNRDNDPRDDEGHGTHVAGTVAALKNGSGVVGVAPGAKLYALKVLDATGSGVFSDVIAALEWAVTNGIQVTNNSYGQKGNPGGTVQSAFDNAYAAGVLNVAAAGNSGTCAGKGDSVEYPAKFSSVMAVSATNLSDQSPCFSSTGPDVELSAPGVNVNSTLLGGGYGTKSGTSMASPHVVGTAALVIAAGVADCNGINGVADEARGRMNQTADDLGATGRDTWFGYGLVDANEAATSSTCAANNPPTANFSYSASGLTVNFTDQSTDSDGSVVAWSWTFGDGGTLATQNPSHTYAAGGTYTVALTVTDNGGATGSTSKSVVVYSGTGSGIALSATGYKVKGLQKVDLTWSGATSTDIDVYRNATKITTANDGSYTDNIDQRGGGSYIYKVCEAGTSTCSNEARVIF